MSTTRVVRYGLGAVGVALMLVAVLGILRDRAQTAPVSLAVWLAAGVALHDGLLAPVLIGIGALVFKVVPAHLRGVVSVGLVAAGTVLLVAVPIIIASHRPKQNATILPLNYVASLLVIEATLLLLTAIGVAFVLRRRARLKPLQAED
jgi:hypothetical protein